MLSQYVQSLISSDYFSLVTFSRQGLVFLSVLQQDHLSKVLFNPYAMEIMYVWNFVITSSILESKHIIYRASSWLPSKSMEPGPLWSCREFQVQLLQLPPLSFGSVLRLSLGSNNCFRMSWDALLCLLCNFDTLWRFNYETTKSPQHCYHAKWAFNLANLSVPTTCPWRKALYYGCMHVDILREDRWVCFNLINPSNG